VELRVLAQPYRESSVAAQTFITTALGDDNVSRVLIVTAWVRRSGMEPLVPGLEAVRRRGGTARLLVGIDLQGTSRQGLALARRHFNDVHAVHDPTGRTFHPKIYLAVGHRVGYALIGSNNLTAGGLWHNYEAAVTAMFDPRRETEISGGIQDYAEQLLADKAICKRITQTVFNRLVTERWITDETKDRRRNEDRPGGDPRRRAGSEPPLFTRSKVQKRNRPAPVQSGPARRRISSRARRRLATSADTWSKPLGAGDAQHPLVGNATGNVALTHIPPGHDQGTFFREEFFGAENWRRMPDENGKRTELATITADVEIGGDKLGRYELTAVYRPYRRARGRATTVLRWEELLPELRLRDVTDWYLLIERGGIGLYRLRLTPKEPA
jgi:hypothetical protein